MGSNLGDPLENCRRGIAAVDDNRHATVLAVSRFYRTAPVDFTDQAWFVNAAVKIATRLPPLELLAVIQAIQAAAGTTPKTVRFGPRELDLDILLFDQWMLNWPHLQIPHPRLHKRHFVLRPLCDIDPTIFHPTLRCRMDRLLAELDTSGQDIMACP